MVRGERGAVIYGINVCGGEVSWGEVVLQRRVCAEFVPIKAVVVDEGGDVLESLKCDGVGNGGVWGVGMEAFPVVTIVANEVGDRAEDLVWYDGGHGVVRRRGGNQ